MKNLIKGILFIVLLPLVITGSITYCTGVLIQSIGMLFMLDGKGSKTRLITLWRGKK